MSATWSEREALAEQLVPLVGQLHRGNKVVTTVFGRSLVHKSVTEIIKVHRFARRIMGEEMPLEKTVEIVTALGALNLGVCNVDVAKLYQGYTVAGSGDLQAYLREALAPAVDQRGVVFQRLHQVRLQGVAQKHRHGAVHLKVARRNGAAIAGLGDDVGFVHLGAGGGDLLGGDLGENARPPLSGGKLGGVVAAALEPVRATRGAAHTDAQAKAGR